MKVWRKRAGPEKAGLPAERGGIGALGAWRDNWNMIESTVKNKIEKGEGRSEKKIAPEIKIYIKEGRERWRESGQSQRNDKGNLLTEEVSKLF